MKKFDEYAAKKYYPAIVKELDKYPSNYKQMFMKTFPCSAEPQFLIGIPIEVIVKARQVGHSMQGPYIIYEYIGFSSEKDFWDRWNRFKNVKVFL